MRDGAPTVTHRTVTQDGSAVERLAAQLGETLRLATLIADAAACSDIKSFCVVERQGLLRWYDTRRPLPDAPGVVAAVERAVRYLRLREHIVTHPTQPALVRFVSTFPTPA